MLRRARALGVPDRLEERRLLALAQDGDQDAREQMIVRNSPFVVTVIKHYVGRGIEPEDLFQSGLMGADTAVTRFDLSNTKWRFISYAVWWIRQAALAEIQLRGAAIRVPTGRQAAIAKTRRILATDRDMTNIGPHEIAKRVGVSVGIARILIEVARGPISLDATLGQRAGGDDSSSTLGDLIPDTSNLDPLDALEFEGFIRMIDSDKRMTTRERDILMQRIAYGRTLEDIGEDYGLSRERIRQIEKEALGRVRKIARDADKKAGISRHDRLTMIPMGVAP